MATWTSNLQSFDAQARERVLSAPVVQFCKVCALGLLFYLRNTLKNFSQSHKITEPATLVRLAGASPTLFGFQGHCANLVYPFVLHANLARRGFWTSFPCFCKTLTNPNRRINQTVTSCSTECISKRTWIKNHCGKTDVDQKLPNSRKRFQEKKIRNYRSRTDQASQR